MNEVIQFAFDFHTPAVKKPRAKGKARRTDPETSHIAAESINTTHLEGLVLGLLEQYGAHGLTSEEIADKLGIERVTISPRLRPLAKKGLVREGKDKRLGSSGRPAIVWIAVKHN